MKTLPKFISAAVLIAAAVAVCAPAPNAGSEHFVIVNDNDTTGNNYGTVLKLEGTKKSPALSQVASLATASQAGSLGASHRLFKSSKMVPIFVFSLPNRTKPATEKFPRLNIPAASWWGTSPQAIAAPTPE